MSKVCSSYSEDSEESIWLNNRAQELRRTMTPAELALWPALRALGFNAQVPIYGYTKNGGVYPYILDFLHRPSKVAVEVDGSSHRTRKGRDRRRDTRLAAEGIVTIRIPNGAALKTPDAVLEQIKQKIQRTLESA